MRAAHVENEKPVSLGNRIGGRAIAGLIRLIERTGTIVYEPEDLKQQLAAQHPIILACWHGQFMLHALLKPHPDVAVAAMVARHGDADLIGEAMRRFDVTLVRGAGAGHRKKDRGGSYALRACTKALNQGQTVVMTADVPPGPARRAGEGIIQLARMSGRPIVPVAPATSRFKSLKTWSRMTLNLPFSKTAFVAGPAITVPRDADATLREKLRQDLETSLNDATRRAYALVGRDAARITPNHALSSDAPRPPVTATLRTYQALTKGFSFLAPVVLRHRERQRKEDPARRFERLGKSARERPSGPLVWMHAASVGETNAVTPIMSKLKAERPDLKVLLTTGTTTAAALVEKRLADEVIHQYLPIDVPKVIRRFLDHWRPDLVVLTESEIWPNLIIETSGRDIPIALVNARMSGRSFSRWRKRIATAEALFGRIDLALSQSRVMTYRFRELGCRRVIETGNLKYDNPPPPIDPAAHRELEAAIGHRPILLAASTHAPEEAIVGAAHRQLAIAHPGLLTVIVPRHPARGVGIAEDLKAQGLTVTLRSADRLPRPATDVFVADTLGEMGTFYALAPFAFIGGSLSDRGGQNPIEAIKHDCAVIVGKNTANFAEVYAKLRADDACIDIEDAPSLAQVAGQLLDAPQMVTDLTAKATKVVTREAGAVDATSTALLSLLARCQSTRLPQEPGTGAVPGTGTASHTGAEGTAADQQPQADIERAS